MDGRKILVSISNSGSSAATHSSKEQGEREVKNENQWAEVHISSPGRSAAAQGMGDGNISNLQFPF